MLPVNINCQSLISTGRPGVSRTRDQQLEENMLGLRTSECINCSAPAVARLDWQGSFYKVN